MVVAQASVVVRCWVKGSLALPLVDFGSIFSTIWQSRSFHQSAKDSWVRLGTGKLILKKSIVLNGRLKTVDIVQE
jgi:hypothetical protein